MARRAPARESHDRATDGASGASEPGETSSHASGGASRGIWSGSISFGLLQIPVTLFAAESRVEELRFRLLDKRDLAPIHYQRVSASSGKPVEWKDIVKGYEIEKDSFVVVEPEDLAKANVKATQTIDIQDFVPRDQIDPTFFERPYWIVPQRRAAKAYALLREALSKKGAVAIGTFVLRTREHLVAIMPTDAALMLEVLRFSHELKDPSAIPIPREGDGRPVSGRELGMAEQLVEAMMTDWEPAKYKDRYYSDVMKMIAEKAKTGAVKEHFTREAGEVAHDVVDLFDLLKKSLARSERAANDERPKKAPARSAHGRSRRGRKAA